MLVVLSQPAPPHALMPLVDCKKFSTCVSQSVSLCLFLPACSLRVSVSISFLLITLPVGRRSAASCFTLSLASRGSAVDQHYFSSGSQETVCLFLSSLASGGLCRPPRQTSFWLMMKRGVLCSSELMHQGQSLMTKAGSPGSPALVPLGQQLETFIFRAISFVLTCCCSLVSQSVFIAFQTVFLASYFCCTGAWGCCGL